MIRMPPIKRKINANNQKKTKWKEEEEEEDDDDSQITVNQI